MRSSKYIFLFSLSILFNHFANAQKGLEAIIVEKYYISDLNDSKAVHGGYLPAGSVTYRIFVDMLPNYRFQAAYGVPGHELRIATTTSFFNNEEDGASIANKIKADKLRNNTVMLDSWLSVGAGAADHVAILKEDDTTSAISNADGILKNADSRAGIPISKRDGINEAQVSEVVYYGIEDSMLEIFNNKNSGARGRFFSTNNGSWAALAGVVGFSQKNRVLIAQITTDGNFSFELNIQIGTPYGGVENYVARNPVGDEIQFADLIYSSATAKRINKKNNSIQQNR